MSIDLPKDAEGREIPLDTALLYGKASGEEYEVVCFIFRPSTRQWRVELKRRDDLGIYATENFTLSQPDSWEKLLGDIDKCVVENSVCMYCSKDGTCKNFALRNESSACSAKVLGDILDRIRKLRGED